MQDKETELPQKLARHPVLRVVKALTMVALGVIALAFTVFFLRFAREVSSQAENPASEAVTAPQMPDSQPAADAAQTSATPQ